MIISSIKDDHTVWSKIEVLNKIFVMRFGFAYFHKSRCLPVYINEHVNLQTSFFLSLPFGLRPTFHTVK